MVKIFLASNWKSLEDKAIDLWKEIRPDQPTILVPTYSLRQSFLLRLTQIAGGVLSDTVQVLNRFAERLAFDESPTDRWATEWDNYFATQQAVSKLGLDQRWVMKGIIQQINRDIEELEMVGCEEKNVQSIIGDDLIRRLCPIWSKKRQLLNDYGIYSTAQVFQKATRSLERIRGRPVIIYGFRFLAKLQWAFVRQMVNRINSLGHPVFFFFLYSPLNPSANEDAHFLVDLVKKEWNLDEESLPMTTADPIRYLSENLFQWGRSNSAVSPPSFGQHSGEQSVFFLESAGVYQEVETAVRFLVRLIQSGKIKSFQDAIFFVPSWTEYLPALEWVRSRFSLPLNFVTYEAQVPHPLQKTLFTILQARRNDWDAESVLSLLFDPFIGRSGKRSPLIPLNRQSGVAKRIRERMYLRGADNWIAYLDADEHVADFLREVSQLPGQASFAAHANAWSELIKKWLWDREEHQEVLEKFLSCLYSLSQWECVVGWDTLADLIGSEVCQETKDRAPGLRIAHAESGRGLWAPVVFILGAHDGSFPPSPPAFQLLTERHRMILQKHTNFPFAHSRERYFRSYCNLLWELIGSANCALVISRCHSDADGKERSPSLFYTALWDTVGAVNPDRELIKRQAGDVLPSDNEILSQREKSMVRVYHFFHSSTQNNPLSGIGILNCDSFRQRLTDEYKRYTRPQEGPWDGKEIGLYQTDWSDLWREKEVRVSSLETYQKCPYRFFAEHLLRLYPVRERWSPMDPLFLGSLWHCIVTSFLKELHGKGCFPPLDELQKIATETIEQYKDKIPNPWWELLRQEIVSFCEQIYNAEARQADQWKPVKVEEDIKIKAGELLNIPNNLSDLMLVMRPDRQDCSSLEKTKLRIADYKTGSAPQPKDVREGLHLVLPLAAAAVGAIEMVFLKLLEYRHKTGDYRQSCQLPSRELSLEKAIETAKEAARSALTGIANNVFTVDPYDEWVCRSCQRQALCRKGSLRIGYRSVRRIRKGDE
ncbi:MAG: PD-(D/E)XK nuclease family protein [Armatimonadetes bacterium]|nr:PD-(D/E)XK nuclease family protein [Armatimonadota bacterium]MDW8121047.1 PD-(D/E)XK nuclease family protein [Armatimonadota bacterium]